jgi:hypothetical protein
MCHVYSTPELMVGRKAGSRRGLLGSSAYEAEDRALMMLAKQKIRLAARLDHAGLMQCPDAAKDLNFGPAVLFVAAVDG